MFEFCIGLGPNRVHPVSDVQFAHGTEPQSPNATAVAERKNTESFIQGLLAFLIFQSVSNDSTTPVISTEPANCDGESGLIKSEFDMADHDKDTGNVSQGEIHVNEAGDVDVGSFDMNDWNTAAGYVIKEKNTAGTKPIKIQTIKSTTGYVPYFGDDLCVPKKKECSRSVGESVGNVGIDDSNVLNADCELIEFTIDETPTKEIDDVWWLID